MANFNSKKVLLIGLKGDDPAIIVEASTNKTVNGLQVPSLTDEQLLAIYNATVAGKAVTITDATGKMHFTGVTADMISDEVFVSFVYFDKMVLEYGEGGVTTFQPIGGGSAIDSVDGLTGGTITSRTTIKADSNKDYSLTVQSDANDNGGAYEGGAYVGFKNKIGNVLGYLGIDRDKDAVLNKGGKDYKLGFPISEYVRARRMFNAQGPVTLPFGSVAFTLAKNMSITWREYSGSSDPTGVQHTITTAGPCIMYLTKVGNSGVKNETQLASGIIGYVTGGLDLYDTRSFLTRANRGFQITGNGMLYYISPENLGTDP